MVRKFKLIKEFPLSPTKGTTIIFKDIKDINDGIYDVGALPTVFLEDCTEFPEFWEEIKEKEYEILTLEYKGSPQGNDKYCYLDVDGYYKYKDKLGSNIGSSLEGCLKTGWSIYSIKRLSDSEVFTIGDIVQHMKDNRDRGKIIEFNTYLLPDMKMLVKYESKNYHTEYTDNYTYSNSLEVLEHVKKEPLFTTEDGVDKYLGDSFYFTNNKYDGEIWHPTKAIIGENFNPYIYKNSFSTKEAAEKWVDENKPKYSNRDLFDFFISFNSETKVGLFFDRFKTYMNDKT